MLLIFSSVEQGIEFEAVRGLQVARGLFLQQVQQLATGAAALGDDPALLRGPGGRPQTTRKRLGELSLAMPNALYETTDASGRIVAHCGGARATSRPSPVAPGSSRRTARPSSCGRWRTSAR